jgi:serine-type D-Ala-D-Ala carboxypeptidase (penicillin-binding protein 5/6)
LGGHVSKNERLGSLVNGGDKKSRVAVLGRRAILAPMRDYLNRFSILKFIGILNATWCLGSMAASAQSSVMVVDAYNKKIHVASNANTKRSVGGMAKMVTGMVALDWAAASGVGVNVLATVPSYAPQIAGAQVLDLQPGDKVTLRDLIYAAMMSSDNVAAITLGDFVGRDHLSRLGRGGDPLGEFVRQMNQLAVRQGCKGSRFTNPHGVENTRVKPYSTAADMARIALYAAARPSMRFYTNQASRDIAVYRGGQKMMVTVTNNNTLLGASRIDGIKASSTPSSGGCVVLSAEKDASVFQQADGASVIYRHRLVVVVLGSSNPFGEGQMLLRQGWSVYDQWLQSGRPITDQRQLLANY